MKKYRLEFTTTIRGQVTVEAEDREAAALIGEEKALDTLNYEDLSDGGRHAPDVETEFEDLDEVTK